MLLSSGHAQFFLKLLLISYVISLNYYTSLLTEMFQQTNVNMLK